MSKTLKSIIRDNTSFSLADPIHYLYRIEDFIQIPFAVNLMDALFESDFIHSIRRSFQVKELNIKIFDKILRDLKPYMYKTCVIKSNEWWLFGEYSNSVFYVRARHSEIGLCFWTNDLKEFKNFYELMKNTLDDFLKKTQDKIVYFVFFDDFIRTVAFPMKDVSNYIELPYIDTEEYAEKFFSSNSPCLFVYGVPGTGKTFFAWKLADLFVEKVKGDVLFVKDLDVAATSEFWFEELMQKTPFLVIFDDLDVSIKKNHSDDWVRDFARNLKYFIDSFSSKETKFLFTFNSSKIEIDQDILRSGRTFDYLEFRKLTSNEANEFAKKFSGSDCRLSFKDEWRISEIISYLQNDPIERKVKKLGFN